MGTKKVIGTRKTLVFYTKASPKPIRTGWIIHEYEYFSDLSLSKQREFVLCKLKKDPDAIMPTYEEGEASFNVTSDHSENQNPTGYNHPQTFEEGEYGAWTASNFTNNEPEEDTYQFEAQLDSLRGYDEGCYSLDSALQFQYGDIY
ncbi:hypothetical protein D5086_026114 [Populus alba]|uniref:Uncharacterized protein n=1 Tax=Populus alba TaxID=43335 RepID=A0ACC4B145_POPAL